MRDQSQLISRAHHFEVAHFLASDPDKLYLLHKYPTLGYRKKLSGTCKVTTFIVQ